MTTKADFTPTEWETMQKGVTGAGLLVAASEPGFRDSFKEAHALAKHLSDARGRSDNVLVRDLAEAHGTPFGMTASKTEVEQGTVDSLHAAVSTLEAKSPGDLPAYRQFVLDVATSVAEAAGGVAPAESEALQTVRSALGEA